ncbi:MAG: hypothetical protein AB7P34_15975 [Vicinamibacterales bacterium]
MSQSRQVSVVAGISCAYDLTLGLALLAAADSFAALFGMVVPEPRTFVTITGLLLVCVGLGYIAPWKAPDTHRTYMWIFGPVLKGAGALVFVLEHLAGAPASYLVFAASDGTLALVTLAVLLKR